MSFRIAHVLAKKLQKVLYDMIQKPFLKWRMIIENNWLRVIINNIFLSNKLTFKAMCI